MAFFQLSDKSSSQLLGETVAAIYHYSQGVPLEEFKQHCYDEINKLVSLGRCYWLVKSHTALPDSERTLLMLGDESPRDELFDSLSIISLPVELTQCDLSFYGLTNCQNVAACEVALADEGVVHQFIFSPAEQGGDFSEEEVQSLNGLVPHLHEAFRLNVLSRIQSQDCGGVFNCALCDIDGNLIAMDEGFSTLMQTLQAGWDGILVPFDLPDASGFVVLEGVVINCTRTLDVFSLQTMRFAKGYDQLTTKELQVCFYLKQAMSNQEIAEAMSLSYKTVENHFSNIYRKLTLKNRSQLLAFLSRD